MTDIVATELSIRVEIPGNIPAVREVNERAFGRETEAALVDTLRANGKFALSLVAALNEQIVGHILFTDLLGSAQRLAALAPMAVLPDHQRAGIGSALIRTGFEYLREQGYDAVVVLGHKDYYPRFGFVPGANFGITTPFDVPPEYLLVAQLSVRPVAPGKMLYQPEFEAVAP
ncbi:GNAT family N-acetyltransferase [Aromatoleum diolicum]|uniref:GNAT family N-acetyltransferase n=1 Tax=Aromatoleum diolicum TaxID=75796 RepID=A0ABX1QFC0_9RHOO|nr:N-acetyltransferase [Aromatoleum diolicum]NMG77013.1 GNAT family N-acetyltransferase [Aromatoleum diolicum]